MHYRREDEGYGDWALHASLVETQETIAFAYLLTVLLFARSTDAPGHKGVSAFLVPAGQSAEFEARVERCASRLAPRACEVTLTGPWPPSALGPELA